MIGNLRNRWNDKGAILRLFENLALIPQHLEEFARLAPLIEKWIQANPTPKPATGLALLNYINSAVILAKTPADVLPHLEAIHAKALADGIIPAGTTLTAAAGLSRFQDRLTTYTKWPLRPFVMDARLNDIGYLARRAAKIIGAAGVGCGEIHEATGVDRCRLRGGRLAAVLVAALLGALMHPRQHAAYSKQSYRDQEDRLYASLGYVSTDVAVSDHPQNSEHRYGPNEHTKANIRQVEVLL